MSDEKLVQMVAELWVDHGGDAEGFDWCIRKIRDAIDRLIDEKEVADAKGAAAKAAVGAEAAAKAPSSRYVVYKWC